MSAPCGPCGTHAGRPVAPCIRCGSALSHMHLRTVDRGGQTDGDVPMCRVCIGTLTVRGKPLTAFLVDNVTGA